MDALHQQENVCVDTWRIRVPGGWLYVVTNESFCSNWRAPDAPLPVPMIACTLVPAPRIDILSALIEAQAEVEKLILREHQDSLTSKMGESLTHQGYASGLERAMDIVRDRVKGCTA